MSVAAAKKQKELTLLLFCYLGRNRPACLYRLSFLLTSSMVIPNVRRITSIGAISGIMAIRRLRNPFILP